MAHIEQESARKQMISGLLVFCLRNRICLFDASLSVAKRERLIRTLTTGPPEFSDQRVDLPNPRK
jgi:hypothetical protein